jgi:hypothetical protein
MRMHAPPVLFLLLAWISIPAGAESAAGAVNAADPGSLSGFLFSTFLANFSIAFTIVLLLVFGLYAYASLARFAPYHSWIYLYLVSLTGVVWAVFLFVNSGTIADSVFLLTTVIGLNLIVHILRFDRVMIGSPEPRKSAGPLFE